MMCGELYSARENEHVLFTVRFNTVLETILVYLQKQRGVKLLCKAGLETCVGWFMIGHLSWAYE